MRFNAPKNMGSLDTADNSGRNFSKNPASKKRRMRKKSRASFRLSSLTSYTPLNFLIAALFAASMLSFPIRSAIASNPAAGTITPAGPTQQWDGTAAGTVAANESTCVEGVNCDTYTLNVAPGDYTGKLIAVKIQWTDPANDYDLYITRIRTLGPSSAVLRAAPRRPARAHPSIRQPQVRASTPYTPFTLL